MTQEDKLALALAAAHDKLTGEKAELALRAGPGPAVEYWEALAKAALSNTAPADSVQAIAEGARAISDEKTKLLRQAVEQSQQPAPADDALEMLREVFDELSSESNEPGDECCRMATKISMAVHNLKIRRARFDKLVREARDILVAVKFNAPPANMGGTDQHPNLCYEARVPIAFVENLEAALPGIRQGDG